MTATENTVTAIARTSTGTKTHVVYKYDDGSIGRYASCGADTRFARLIGETEPTCKKCAKALPATVAFAEKTR